MKKLVQKRLFSGGKLPSAVVYIQVKNHCVCGDYINLRSFV